MSTKTTFKRIALVAVAALGLGVLSVAPSQATVANLAVTVTNGTAGLAGAASDSSTAAVINITALMEAGDSITVEVIQKSTPTGSGINAAGEAKLLNFDSATPTISGYVVETLTGKAPGVRITNETGTFVNGTLFPRSATAYAVSQAATVRIARESTTASAPTANINQSFKLQLDSATTNDGGNDTRTAGTYTYTIIVKTWGGQANNLLPASVVTKDVSIVIAAAASASETPSSAFSGAYIGSASTVSPTADSATVSGVATAGTTAGNLNIMVRNALNGTAAIDTVTVTIVGPGLLDLTGATDSKYYRGVGIGDTNLPILGDGSAGTATITVAYELTKQTFTKTVTFYAVNAKTLTPSVRTPILKVGTNTGAASVSAVDANGNPWLGTVYIAASSAADALVAGSTTPAACSAWTATNGIRCDITGVSAGTAKLTVMDASTLAASKATAEWTVTVSTAVAAGVKVEFDKTTYAPYEKATITVSPVDAAGNLVPANTFANLFATGGIAASQSFTGTSDTLSAVSVATEVASSSTTGAVALKKIYTVYMPAQGDVTLSWTGGTSLTVAGQVKGSVTAAVVNDSVNAATDAANEATDAANAATDAALAAADAADAATAAAQDASDAVAALSASVSKLISSLRAQITSLTNLVIKIQKKVRA
jgi:trimeric autotransporter adhesin